MHVLQDSTTKFDFKFIHMQDCWQESIDKLIHYILSLSLSLSLYIYIYIYIYNYYPVAGYKITYSVVTLSYDNYYINLRDYSNSLLSGLL